MYSHTYTHTHWYILSHVHTCIHIHTYMHTHTHTFTHIQAVSGIKYIGDDLNACPVASGHCLGTGTAGVGGIIKCTGGGSIR